MKKKVLSILLTICMILTLLPGVALAAETTEVYVGDVNMAAAGNENIIPGASYDKEGNTLTLTKDFKTPETFSETALVYANGDLNVVLDGCSFDAGATNAIRAWAALNMTLIGESSIRADETVFYANAITVSAEEGGALEALSDNSKVFYATAYGIHLKSGTLTLAAPKASVLYDQYGNITVEEGVNLTAESGFDQNGTKIPAVFIFAAFGGTQHSGKDRKLVYRNGTLTATNPLTELSVMGVDMLSQTVPGASYEKDSNTLTLTGTFTVPNGPDYWNVVESNGDLNVVLDNCIINCADIASAIQVSNGFLNLRLRGTNSATNCISAYGDITLSANPAYSSLDIVAAYSNALYSNWGGNHGGRQRQPDRRRRHRRWQ